VASGPRFGRDCYPLPESCGRGFEGSLPCHLARWHIELVFNLGDSVYLDGPAYTGDQPERVVFGPLSQAIRMKYGGRVQTFGIRFHPARGAGFLGQTAPTLTDKLVPLAQVCQTLDRSFSQLLAENGSRDTEAGPLALDRMLLGHLLWLFQPTGRWSLWWIG
jgi:hypothetical protein